MAQLIKYSIFTWLRWFGKTVFLGVGLLGIVTLSTPNAAGQAETAPVETDEKMIADAALEKYLEQQLASDFVYRREGRPDPFFPFITQEILQTEAEAEQLTGMRRFEPGQLTLVAIIFTEQKALAMFQDSAGIGYTLEKGDKIGRSGEVIDIMPNKVLIQEISYSLTKEKRYRTVEMVLKKEGDK
jgi:type IV pilus assembly protein PilP